MADIPTLLANYDALVGVALGAGLTYGFSALSRRHQEAREDKTRWYQARLQAYSEFSRVLLEQERLIRKTERKQEDIRDIILSLQSAGGMIRLVGSTEVLVAFTTLLQASDADRVQFFGAVAEFEEAARKDLGHPSP